MTKFNGSGNILLLLITISLLLKTKELAGTEEDIHTLPPTTVSVPITVFPPRMVALAYMITLSLIVGCLFVSASSFFTFSAPRVTP